MQTSISVKCAQLAAGQATERLQRPAVNPNINKKHMPVRLSCGRPTGGAEGRSPQTGGPPAAGAGVLGEPCPATGLPSWTQEGRPCPGDAQGPVGQRAPSPHVVSWQLAGRAGRGWSWPEPGQGSWGAWGNRGGATPSFQTFLPGSPHEGWVTASSPPRPFSWLIWGT